MKNERAPLIVSEGLLESQGENEDYVLGEQPYGVPGEIVVKTEKMLTTDEHVTFELTEGQPASIARTLQERGKKVTAVVKGSRDMALHVWDEHRIPVLGATATIIAGTTLLTLHTISKNRKNTPEE